MITIKDLIVALPGFTLRDINLGIRKNEFFVLMGPTGAGKTVLLEAIAGLVRVKSGKIFIRDREVTRSAPEKREIGIVYQDHALFPHLTARQNIRYGLHFHRIDRAETERKLRHLIEMLNISHILDRLPGNLSGGEKQRVALARALVVEPKVLLLDEPLSALDPNFREELRRALKHLHQSSRGTFLMVTHDFTDALFLADRAAVIHQGRIRQIGTTAEVFQHPTSPFVAEFVGMKNIFPATFHEGKAVVGGLEIDLDSRVSALNQYLAIRPEDILISSHSLSRNGYISFRAKIVGMADYGFYYTISAETTGGVFHASMPKSFLLDMGLMQREGAQVYVNFRRSSIHTF